MVTVGVLMFASPLYAAPVPVDLISQGSSGWDYGVIAGGDFQALYYTYYTPPQPPFNPEDNFYDITYSEITWSTPNTGTAAFGNTQNTEINRWLSNGMDELGNTNDYHQTSVTTWSPQTALALKKTFTIADPSLVSDINLSVASDNGFIVWIKNGLGNINEVYRHINPTNETDNLKKFTSYWEYTDTSYAGIGTGDFPDFSGLTPGLNTMYVLAIDDHTDWNSVINPNSPSGYDHDATFFDLQLTANVVPVPTTIILFVTGLAALFGIKRRTTA